MYLLPIHVPVFVDGQRRFLSTEWHRSMCLLRDSLAGRFGPLVMAAPSYPAANSPHQKLEEVTASDGMELVASFDDRVRCRDYWMKHRSEWLRTLAPLVDRAQVVHAAMDDVYRPISFAGFRMAVARGRMSVLVQDTDIVLQNRQLAGAERMVKKLRRHAYAVAFERCVRWGVRHADLSLLKGSVLMSRYSSYAKHSRTFHDTSHSRAQIVAWPIVADRLKQIGSRSLRLVYCGRLEPRKGLMASLELLHQVSLAGRRIHFDIIGDGSQRPELEQRVAELGLQGNVHFLGRSSYGPELIGKLAEYDGLLFTPMAEDTPRMIFDGYAAALPLIAFDIDYVRERGAEDRAAVILPRHDRGQAAGILAQLATDPAPLIPLTEAAHAAAGEHCIENWYARRAAWTVEAYERHTREQQQRGPSGASVEEGHLAVEMHARSFP